MKSAFVIMFLISLNSTSQIIDLKHPSSFSIPDIKEGSYNELLKDIKCKNKQGLTISCLNLNDRDTFLVFYPHEAFYQNTYLFSYWKKGDSAVGTVYYDKGFTKPLGDASMGAEWKPGFVLKYSSNIPDPIYFSDLLNVLKDTVLRTMDTTFFMSHDPDYYFSFYFDNGTVHRAVHRWRTMNSPVIRKLTDQFFEIEKKFTPQ